MDTGGEGSETAESAARRVRDSSQARAQGRNGLGLAAEALGSAAANGSVRTPALQAVERSIEAVLATARIARGDPAAAERPCVRARYQKAGSHALGDLLRVALARPTHHLPRASPLQEGGSLLPVLAEASGAPWRRLLLILRALLGEPAAVDEVTCSLLGLGSPFVGRTLMWSALSAGLRSQLVGRELGILMEIGRGSSSAGSKLLELHHLLFPAIPAAVMEALMHLCSGDVAGWRSVGGRALAAAQVQQDAGRVGRLLSVLCQMAWRPAPRLLEEATTASSEFVPGLVRLRGVVLRAGREGKTVDVAYGDGTGPVELGVPTAWVVPTSLDALPVERAAVSVATGLGRACIEAGAALVRLVAGIPPGPGRSADALGVWRLANVLGVPRSGPTLHRFLAALSDPAGIPGMVATVLEETRALRPLAGLGALIRALASPDSKAKLEHGEAVVHQRVADLLAAAGFALPAPAQESSAAAEDGAAKFVRGALALLSGDLSRLHLAAPDEGAEALSELSQLLAAQADVLNRAGPGRVVPHFTVLPQRIAHVLAPLLTAAHAGAAGQEQRPTPGRLLHPEEMPAHGSSSQEAASNAVTDIAAAAMAATAGGEGGHDSKPRRVIRTLLLMSAGAHRRALADALALLSLPPWVRTAMYRVLDLRARDEGAKEREEWTEFIRGQAPKVSHFACRAADAAGWLGRRGGGLPRPVWRRGATSRSDCVLMRAASTLTPLFSLAYLHCTAADLCLVRAGRVFARGAGGV